MSDEIRQIKDKIDLVSFISQSVPLKKSGRNYKGLCPFHGEKTPSFMVSPELQIFKCFGCGLGGDLFTFLMQREGLEFREALEELAQKTGVKLHRRLERSPEDDRRERLLAAQETAAQFYHYLLLQHRLGQKPLDYLKKGRGLTEETIEKFRLGYAPDARDSLTKFLVKKSFSTSEILEAGLASTSEKGGGLYDRFRGRVVFPLSDSRGRVLGFSGRTLRAEANVPKYLNSPETPIFHKGTFLYGLDLARAGIKKMGQVLVVEGQMDLVSNVQAGINHIVATSGTALTPSQLMLLKKLASEIVFCFDADEAGLKALERAVVLSEAAGLTSLVAKLPIGAKDPDQAAREKLTAWRELLKKPISFYDFYLSLVTKDLGKNDGLGKKRAAEKILPKLLQIKDPLQKAHFIKRSAQLLDLDEGAIHEALARLSKPSARVAPRWPASGGADSGSRSSASWQSLKGSARLETVRKYFLALALRLDREFTRPLLKELSEEDFVDSSMAPFFKLVKDGRLLSLSQLREKLPPDLQETLSELCLIDLGPLETDRDLQKKEISLVFRELKGGTLREKIRESAVKIRLAEEGGREKELQDHQQTFQKLSQQIKLYGS